MKRIQLSDGTDIAFDAVQQIADDIEKAGALVLYGDGLPNGIRAFNKIGRQAIVDALRSARPKAPAASADS